MTDQTLRMIRVCSSSTEEQFLEIGSRLEASIDTVSALREMFSTLTAERTGGNIHDATQSFSKIAARVSAIADAQDREAIAFNRLITLTLSIERRVQGIHRAVVDVGILAMNAKIAAAQISKGDLGLVSFTNDINQRLELERARLDRFVAELYAVRTLLQSAAAAQAAVAEVRSLSDSAAKAAVAAREGIQRLQATSDRRLQAEEEARQESALLETVAFHAQAAEDSFGRLAEQGRNMLVVAQASGAMVAVAMMDAIGTAQFQDIVRQKLGHVSEGLERLGLHAVEMADVLQAKACMVTVEDRLLEPMRKAYVMQSEHTAHANVDGSTAAASGLAIDLF